MDLAAGCLVEAVVCVHVKTRYFVGLLEGARHMKFSTPM